MQLLLIIPKRTDFWPILGTFGLKYLNAVIQEKPILSICSHCAAVTLGKKSLRLHVLTFDNN